MEIVLVIVVYGLIMCICFCIGAIVGQKVSKGEQIKIPNPIGTVVNKIETAQAEKERKKLEEEYKTIAENIDNYDGTSKGQKRIPRR